MSRTISFRDLMLCSKFAHLKNEVELLNIENDKAVEEVLRQVGFDTDYPVSYIPSKHRDLQNQVGVGFMAVGEISLNRAFTSSYLCTPIERLIAASYTDPSLTREMSNLMGNHVNFKSLLENEAEGENEELPEDQLEPDRSYVAAQIKSLEILRDTIRGSMYNDAGDIKTFAEYQN